MKLLRIGELAKAAGITVRSLHHYDHIGLLCPTLVQDNGHRCYNQKDIERLQQIICLKSLGLSLVDIAHCLNGEYDLQKTLMVHEAAISASIDNLRKIKDRLYLMLDKLARNKSLTASELLAFIREVQMEKHYTKEQLEKLKDRYERYPDQVEAVKQAWPVLFEKFEKAMRSKIPITDLKVQVLATEAQHYIDLFTGGDQEIEKNLDKSYDDQQKSALSTWGISKEVFEYAFRARENLKKIKKLDCPIAE